MLPKFDKSGLIAWLSASILGCVLMNLGDQFVNWYATVTFVVAASMYLMLMPRKKQILVTP
ncbi:hypothetical protein LVJ82_01690 [Vitreoscilla massiliensis]|uniref:Uncharacterized protein n=2 Tax=Vitreoscilla massiliensis TaxID=1689272 RepID=A0ABY4E313_9NEIS|nr:hypothetical protein [Vitreoscilla massiliensis]UOO89728.1 hypothetical protein LVJ82_01690 [Vitreoscilla massiliensis]